MTALLNEGGRGALQGRATRRALGAMVVVEVMLAIALVAGAARLSLSMKNLLTVDPGFTAAGRLVIDVDLPVRPYVVEPARIDAWQVAADTALTSLGATAVGVASSVPMRHEWDSTVFVDITGRPTDPANRPNARLRVAGPGFFDVMGIKMVAGRPLAAGDDRRGAEPVVLVNQAWARRFLPGLDPLRERVNPGAFSQRVDGKFVARDAAIVGVVRDVPYVGLSIPAEPTVYIADAQTTSVRRTIVITTATGHPETLIPQIRTALNQIDPHVAIECGLMSTALAASLMGPKLGLLLMVTFGGQGLAIAATGVFGVIAFVTSQRSSELAVRLALGATPSQVFGIILRQSGQLALTGLVFGVLLAWWLGAPMARYVFQVSPASVIVLGGSAAIVLIVALAATLPSARRAAGLDPARVFRG